MSDKYKIKGNIYREVFASFIQEITKEKIEDFGIVSLINIEISKDYTYADFYVNCQKNEKELLKYLSDFAPEIKKIIGKKLQAKKSPIIRFKIAKNNSEFTDLVKLIEDLNKGN